MEFVIWGGLAQGAIFVLLGAGFILSYLPSGVLNFAQGALVVGGSYLAYIWLHNLGFPGALAVALNIVIGIAIGCLCELVTVRPLRRRRNFRHEGHMPSGELLTTVGMAQILTGVYGRSFGYNPVLVPFIGPSSVIHLPGVAVLPVQVTVVALAIVVPLGLFVGFRSTRLGQACLAIAEDRDAAALRGINVSLLSLAGFGAAGLLAGLAAMVIGPITFAVPTLANSLALDGFVALAIGGEGSFAGLLVGGLGVGVVTSVVNRYFGPSYSDLSILICLLLVITIRPQGLGIRRRARSV